jgi:hypothetical protein
MTFRRALALLVFAGVFAASAFAQGVTGGSLQWQQGGTVPASGLQFVDFGRPITADGTITRAALRWLTDFACAGAFRIRIFRPMNPETLAYAHNWTLVGETQPLAVTKGNNLLLVSFAGIAVKKGDLVGIAHVQQGCGGSTMSQSSQPGDMVLQLTGNYNGGSTVPQATLRRNYRLDVLVSSSEQILAGVIPVVGSVQGQGAFFRSSLQLTNPGPFPINGKLVFHPANQAGSDADPSINYQIPGGGSIAYSDITAAFNRTGLGTIDLYTSSITPEVTSRVFNDLGTAGTFGFTQELVTPTEMFEEDVPYTRIPLSPDLTNYRVNLGVRTLGGPVSVIFGLLDANGALRGSNVTRNYPANYFEQISVAQLFGSTPLPEGGNISAAVVSGGRVVFYTSTVDNRTNDSSLKMITAK